MKNKIALRLSLYFGIVLLVFSIVLAFVYFFVLRKNTIEMQKTQIESTTFSIAEDMSYLLEQVKQERGHRGGLGAYLRYMNSISGFEVWVLDSNKRLITTQIPDEDPIPNVDFNNISSNTRQVIDTVFTGDTILESDPGNDFSEHSLVSGTPILDSEDNTIGAVIVFSAVGGLQDTLTTGTKILGISIGFALILAIALSLKLSKSFTDPIVSKKAMDALKMENTRKEFVANISHELKTPITVLRGSLEALIDGVVEEKDVLNYKKQMLTETIYLQRLVGDLLDLSSLQSKDFTTQKQDVILEEIIKDVVRSLDISIKNKNITVLFFGLDKQHHIMGDYGRLRQMFLIILDNAVKYSYSGGKILISFKNNILSISDEGPGISKDELPFIFERFYRSRSEQDKHGTGLGLSIAKQIAAKHDIDLSVESVPNVETKFILKLP